LLQSFLKAFDALRDDAIRRVLYLSVGGAVLLLIVLGAAAGYLVQRIHFLDIAWLNWVIDLLSGLAILALVWVTFPGSVGVVMSFFLERVAARIEGRHYPGLPPAREPPVFETVGLAVNFALVSISLNLLAVPIYFLLPVINIFVFYSLNGYLLGREYFELVALRRLDEVAARALRRAHQGTIFLGGAAIAFLLTVPLLNLAAPVIATAFMVHLFEALRRRVGMVQSA
jgi:CysZ protein